MDDIQHMINKYIYQQVVICHLRPQKDDDVDDDYNNKNNIKRKNKDSQIHQNTFSSIITKQNIVRRCRAYSVPYVPWSTTF